MGNYLALLLALFAGVVLSIDIYEIYHNAEMPWASFWDVLFVSSPGFLFEAVASLILGITSYCCWAKK